MDERDNYYHKSQAILIVLVQDNYCDFSIENNSQNFCHSTKYMLKTIP